MQELLISESALVLKSEMARHGVTCKELAWQLVADS